MSLKGAKSPTRGRKLRSSGTKARAHISNVPNSLIELKKQLEARTRELAEALEQQTATSEVLGVISSSPGELAPVFRAMLANAMRICEAQFGTMHEFADGAFRALWSLGLPPALAEYNREWRVWGPDTGLGQVARTKQTVHVVDAREGRAYANRDPGRMAATELGGVRTLVIVPLLKDGVLIGAMSIFRQEVRPFTDKQIALVTNFAAQAVIAIENTRLLNELRQRTDDLTEALEQQTATSEVLRVISSSPGEPEQIFNVILENAVRLSKSNIGNLIFMTERRSAPPRCTTHRRPMSRRDAGLCGWFATFDRTSPSPASLEPRMSFILPT